MVLLEIVGGRKNVSLVEDEKDKSKRKWQYFPKIVNEKVKQGKIMEIVDDRLIEYDENEVIKLVYIALWCVQEKPRLRPSMAKVDLQSFLYLIPRNSSIDDTSRTKNPARNNTQNEWFRLPTVSSSVYHGLTLPEAITSCPLVSPWEGHTYNCLSSIK
ncbi:hypothetical protein RYX36_037120 [Vicia faba]